MGDRRDSNPQHPESQSGVYTNFTTVAINDLRLGPAGVTVCGTPVIDVGSLPIEGGPR